VQNGGMNTPLKQLPDNVEQFRIAGLAMDAFDQEIMVSLRRLADLTGETVEEHINRAIIQFVKRCEADRELATKLIPFPKQTHIHERASASDYCVRASDESRKRARVQRIVSVAAGRKTVTPDPGPLGERRGSRKSRWAVK
jgi:hypothetical protein